MQQQRRPRGDASPLRCDECGGDSVDGIDEHGQSRCIGCRAEQVGRDYGERSAALELLELQVDHVLDGGLINPDDLLRIVTRAVAACQARGGNRMGTEADLQLGRKGIRDELHTRHDVMPLPDRRAA